MQRPSVTDGPSTTGCATPPNGLVLRCLGNGQLAERETNGSAAEGQLLASGKPLAILVYLVLSPGRSAPREQLINLLWGDRETAAGRKQLRTALSMLRTIGATPAIDADDNVCHASEAIWCDAAEFERLLSRGELDAALELYRGDFFVDFSSPGSNSFDDWADAQRAYLRSAAARTAESLARQALDRGRFSDARHAARRLQEIDPNSEMGSRLLIETCLASGDRVLAMAESARFRNWLALLEEREPEPASATLLRLADQTPRTGPENRASPGTPTLIAAELVGREAEFKTILDAWSSARTGRSRIIQLTGQPGIGKTRVLTDVANRLRASRARVVVARAYAGERGLAYSFAAQLVEALVRLPGALGLPPTAMPALIALNPRVRDVFRAAPEASASIVSAGARSLAIQDLISAVSEETTIALLLDDLHWTDRESRTLLASVLSHVAQRRLLIVCASRAPIGDLAFPEQVTRLQLHSFTRDQVVALIGAVASVPSSAEWLDPVTDRVLCASGGNPLQVLSTLSRLIELELLAVRDEQWVALSSAATICQSIDVDPQASRLAALAPNEVEFLRVCALHGRPLGLAVARRAMSAGTSISDSTLLELERLGLLTDVNGSYELSHDTVGERAIALSSSEADAARLRLGRVLATDPASDSRRLGIRLLIEAGAVEEVIAQTRTAVIASGQSGRDVMGCVVGILGSDASPALIRSAVRALPIRARFAASTLGAASIALVIVLSAGVAAVGYAMHPRDRVPTLEIFSAMGPRTVRFARIELTNAALRSPLPLEVREDRRADTLPWPGASVLGRVGSDEWLFDLPTNDAGGIDVAIAKSDGSVHRLTHVRFDQSPGSWSPDGRYVTVESSEWGTDGRKAVGIIEVATGARHPLDTRKEVQGNSKWSPDGTRIAYNQSLLDGKFATCVESVDGDGHSCFTARARESLLGWTDETHLLVRTSPDSTQNDLDDDQSKGSAMLAEIDVLTGNAEFVRSYAAGLANDLSPDGAWLTTWQYGSSARTISIAPTSDLAHPKTIVLSDSISTPLSMRWVGLSPPRYLASLRLTAKSDTIEVSAPVMLSAEGRTAEGHPITVYAPHWASLDSSVAVVDSQGIVRAMRPGAVTIELSAGGWRTARRAFTVVQSRHKVLMDEFWKGDPWVRWMRFGHPFPLVVDDSLIGPSFWNHGDGDYFSGAYTLEPMSPWHGLALDATVRTRITRNQWQYLQLAFASGHDLSTFRQVWNHVTGYVPGRFLSTNCVFTYPTDEGPRSPRHAIGLELPVSGPDSMPQIARGVPFHVRIQLFPDGRCGMAINGRAALLTRQPIALADSQYVLIQGNSVDTRVLVGHLTVREGVPPGVDWSHVGKTGLK